MAEEDVRSFFSLRSRGFFGLLSRFDFCLLYSHSIGVTRRGKDI